MCTSEWNGRLLNLTTHICTGVFRRTRSRENRDGGRNESTERNARPSSFTNVSNGLERGTRGASYGGTYITSNIARGVCNSAPALNSLVATSCPSDVSRNMHCCYWYRKRSPTYTSCTVPNTWHRYPVPAVTSCSYGAHQHVAEIPPLQKGRHNRFLVEK